MADPITCTNCCDPIALKNDEWVHVLSMRAVCTTEKLPPDFQQDTERGVATYMACPDA